jgi:hypothetical protein
VFIDRFNGGAASDTAGLAPIKALDGNDLQITNCRLKGKNNMPIKTNVK